MTANLVTGFGPMTDFMPQTAANNPSSSTDFSEVLKTSTAKETGDSLNKPKDDTLGKEPKTEVKENQPVENKNGDKVEKTESTEEVNKVEKTEEPKAETPVEEETGISEEAMEMIAEVVQTMVNTIANVLEVPVEQVEEAIQTLGLDELEVIDSSVIPELTVELTDASDTMEIMTSEELFEDVKELMDTANETIETVAKELDIPVEEFKVKLSEQVAVNKEVKEEPKLIVNDDKMEVTTEATKEAEVPVVTTSQEAPKQENRQNSDNHTANEQGMNFQNQVIETLKESVNEINTEVPVSYSSVTTMDEILNQVSDSLKTTMNDEVTEMEMQLHPASLGNVRVQVAARDGVITANFTTQNEEVRQALETQIVQLKEQMNEQGIKVEAIEVTVNAHAFERNLNEEGERGQNNGSEAKKSRTRGINLNDIDDLEEIDEEDRVTADMMARSGNTVDYLA